LNQQGKKAFFQNSCGRAMCTRISTAGYYNQMEPNEQLQKLTQHPQNEHLFYRKNKG